jgi:hypothetical protein
MVVAQNRQPDIPCVRGVLAILVGATLASTPMDSSSVAAMLFVGRGML